MSATNDANESNESLRVLKASTTFAARRRGVAGSRVVSPGEEFEPSDRETGRLYVEQGLAEAAGTASTESMKSKKSTKRAEPERTQDVRAEKESSSRPSKKRRTKE